MVACAGLEGLGKFGWSSSCCQSEEAQVESKPWIPDGQDGVGIGERRYDVFSIPHSTTFAAS